MSKSLTYIDLFAIGKACRNVSLEILERLIGVLKVTEADFLNSKEFKK
jgi:hypothetical protein